MLAGVDLDVVEGEIVLLSGPNGAGKTSLLRLLSGLLALTSGEANVLGHDLAVDRRSVRTQLALLGHDTFCYDDLSVVDNLRFAARAVGRSKHAAVEAADRAVERVGLARQAHLEHRRLSAGQKRRLSLGTALVRDARLLLLDEPHAGLDPEGRDVLDALVRDAASDGRTVVFSSHELDRARGLAGREVRIVAGEAHGGRFPTAAAASPTTSTSGSGSVSSAADEPVAGVSAARAGVDTEMAPGDAHEVSP